jgi:hypothetical protein
MGCGNSCTINAGGSNDVARASQGFDCVRLRADSQSAE